MDAPAPLSLLDLPLDEAEPELVQRLAAMGEPRFRAGQILKQVYGHAVREPAGMTDLPLALRRRLPDAVRIGLLELSHRSVSADGTVKYLWRLADGAEIESVAIPQEDWLSFCVSSQAGCALHCRFCATAALGLKRNLTAGEIVDQVLAMIADAPSPRGAVSVVFMGMGEPGYNMAHVLAACRTLNDPRGLGIGARHLTISTSGVVPAIRQLAAEPLQVRLAVSLHSADQARRENLMDVAKRFPLSELLTACQEYHDATGRLITLEYAVMPGSNDRAEDAQSLARFATAAGAKINPIPYNPVEGFESPPSTERDAARFRRALQSVFDGQVMVRQTRGRDIEAACGMLHRARAAGA